MIINVHFGMVEFTYVSVGPFCLTFSPSNVIYSSRTVSCLTNHCFVFIHSWELVCFLHHHLYSSLILILWEWRDVSSGGHISRLSWCNLAENTPIALIVWQYALWCSASSATIHHLTLKFIWIKILIYKYINVHRLSSS